MTDFEVRNQRVILVRDGASFRLPAEYLYNDDGAARVCLAVLDPEHKAHEEIWVFCVNGKHRIRSAVRVGMGGANAAGVTPSDILRPVIASGCSAFVLCHNHPSGDPTPSAADVRLTRVVLEACRVLGLACLDHVIVAEGGRHESMQITNFELWGSE